MDPLEILTIAVLTAFIDTVIVLVILSKRQERMMGVTKVEQDGEIIYAPLGPDNKPIQVPIGVKEVDGEQQAIMGYAPLAYTLPFIAGDMAAQKMKMVLFNAKSQVAKRMNKEGLAQAMQEGGGLDAMLPFLPKKLQVAAALLRSAGLGNGPSAQNSTPGNIRGGSKAI